MNNTEIPLVSIITVTYNVVDCIENTVLSIIDKKFNDFEYIIVDGNSTDGTVNLLKKHQDKISLWISEPDKGIYDAMNKGIQLAKGKYICFINSGDLLFEIPYKSIINSDADLLVFPVQLSNNDVLIPKNNYSLRIRNTLPHQGCFYKKDKDLRFDTDFKVFSDFCLNQKIYKEGGKIDVFNHPVVAFHDMGGISNDKNHSKEIFKVVRQNFGLHYQLLSWVYFKKQGLKSRIKNVVSKLL